MDPSARRQWLDRVRTAPADPEFADRLERARRIVARSERHETTLFGAALEPFRALDILDAKPDDASWSRKLGVELLWTLLFPSSALDQAVLSAWIREVAVVLRANDEKRARRLYRSLVERSRSAPPVFTIAPPRARPQPTTPSSPSPLTPTPLAPAAAGPGVALPPTPPAPAAAEPGATLPPTPPPAEALRVVRWEIGLAASGFVRVTLHDGAGRTVRSLFSGRLNAGVHHCEADVPSTVLDAIRPLGYVRVELPEGSWQQSAFVPA